MQKFEQIVFFEALQNIELASRQERSDYLERRVLGCCADKGYNALLHRTEKRILLRLAETVNLVNEKNRTCLREEASVSGFLYYFAHVFYARSDGAQRVERHLEFVGDDVGKRSLSHSRRSPKDERRDSSAVNHLP